MFIKMCNNMCVWLLLYSLIFLVNCLEIQEPKHPATIHQHALVRPIVSHARTKRQLSTTRQESGLHHHELSVILNVDGEPYTLDLKLNHHLLPEGHTISYQEGGKTVQHKPKKEEIDLCQYTGHIQGKPDSWVALSTCQGLRGAINDGSKIIYIEPSKENDLRSLHYVYEQDEVKTERRCGNDDLYPEKNSVNKFAHLTKEPNQKNNNDRTRHKRGASFPIRGGPFNATEQSRYVELVLVTDNALYQGVKGNLKRLYHQLQESTNILHAIYAPLNIFIALTGVEVWTTEDRITLSSNSTKTLHDFLQYRREMLLKHIPHHDHAQLITAKKFDEGVIGKAYLSKMGSYEMSGAIIHRPAYHLTADTIAYTASIMAHEMGHSFGMEHDTKVSGCRDKYCIMYSSAVSPIPVHFSDKSLKELMKGLNKGIDYSLRNKPKTLFGAPSCGNGFVDPGEECDCGVRIEGIKPNGCHRCCNSYTCRLRSNATCATGECCNLETCQIIPVASLCRAADRECDLPEYCTGTSEFCPEDVFKMDTTPCSDKAYCVQGKCRSHETQCQLLWGSPAKGGKLDCYNMNTNGDEICNCGYDVLTKRSQRCRQRDASCGRLYCHHFSPRLVYGDFNSYRKSFYSSNYANGFSMCDAVRIDTVSFGDPGMVPDGAECGVGRMCLKQQCVAVDDVRAQIVQLHSEGCRANCSGHGICNSKGFSMCDAVRIDTVSFGDPGMVPDGAECGVGRMCLKQQCVAVDDVRAQIVQLHSEGCRANCSGHGICNSKGQCHCDDGFASPLCDLPGVGGSHGSGPAGDPNVQKTFKLVMYIIFLGLVPMIALILLLIYFMKRKSLLCFAQNTKSHRSISSTTSVKKSVRSLINKKEKDINSTNTSTDFNSNVRRESVKNIAKYDIKIVRDVQAEASLQSKFDINSYVNYRNETHESVMKMTKEDIKVILSGTVEDLQKPLSHGDIIVYKNNLVLRKVSENMTVDVNKEYTPQIKPVNFIKSTYPNLAIPTKHKAGAYNAVSNTVVKQHAIKDNIKVELKPNYMYKQINKLKPILDSKSIINQGNNFKLQAADNIDSRPQQMLLNKICSNSIPSNQAIGKRPIEKNVANTALVSRNVKHKVDTNVNDIKFKPKPKVLPVNKPIPHQKPSTPNQTFTKDPKPTKEVNKVVSQNTLEPWPKLKPVKNSPAIRKNLELSSGNITKGKTNELSKGGLKVKAMKNFYEDL